MTIQIGDKVVFLGVELQEGEDCEAFAPIMFESGYLVDVIGISEYGRLPYRCKHESWDDEYFLSDKEITPIVMEDVKLEDYL